MRRTSLPHHGSATAGSIEIPTDTVVGKYNWTPQRILIVDNDPEILTAMRLITESDGHSVTVANGGKNGIATFLKTLNTPEPFSLVMTDLNMPDVDGRQVASAIKTASPMTVVFLLSGCTARLLLDTDAPLDIDLVLNKPPRRSELRQAIALFLGEGNARALS